MAKVLTGLSCPVCKNTLLQSVTIATMAEKCWNQKVYFEQTKNCVKVWWKQTNKHSVYKEQISSLCCLAVKKHMASWGHWLLLRLRQLQDVSMGARPLLPLKQTNKQDSPKRTPPPPGHSKDASKMLTKTCVTQDAHKKTPIRRYKASVPKNNITYYHQFNSLPLRTIVLICIRVKQLFTEKRTEIKGVFV